MPRDPAVFHYEVLSLDVAEVAHAGKERGVIGSQTRPIVERADVPHSAWLRLQWDAQLVPYLGLWVDEGALNPESVAALEPMTGFYDSLSLAYDRKLIAMIEPGDTHEWTLNVRVGTGEQPFPTLQEGQRA